MSGQFQVTGVHQALTKSPGENLYEVKVDPSESIPKTSPVNLTLHAGEMVVFDLMTNRSGFEKTGKLQLDWIPDQGPPLHSEWTFEPAISDGEQSAVVDAGLYSRNPFFSVPIYHVIQSQTPLTRPIDLRIVASEAARVEVYDESNELVFIGHNGNGDLSETGDVVAIDANADGHGDLSTARKDARSMVFYLQVTPSGEIPEDGLTLQLQNRGASGKWEDVSRDLILPAGK